MEDLETLGLLSPECPQPQELKLLREDLETPVVTIPQCLTSQNWNILWVTYKLWVCPAQNSRQNLEFLWGLCV